MGLTPRILTLFCFSWLLSEARSPPPGMMPPMFPAHHHPARTRRQGDVNWRVSSKMISATVPFGESFGSRRTAVLRCLVPHSFSVQQHLGKRALPFVRPLGLLRRRLPYLGVVVARARTSVLSPSNPKSQKRIHTHTHTRVPLTCTSPLGLCSLVSLSTTSSSSSSSTLWATQTAG